MEILRSPPENRWIMVQECSLEANSIKQIKFRRFFLTLLPLGILAIVLEYGYSFLSWSLISNFFGFSLAKLWAGWDGGFYLAIATQGYVSEAPGAERIAFFPLLPWLIRYSTKLFGSPEVSGLILTNVFFFLSLKWMDDLFQMDDKTPVSNRALLLFTFFPTAFFLHAVYPESLFVAFSLGTFLYVRKEKWLLAGILCFLACLTRLQGIILLPALLWEILGQGNRKFSLEGLRWKNSILVCGFGCLGVFCYLWINYRVFGNPFQFLAAQSAGWSRNFASPLSGLFANIEGIRIGNPQRILSVEIPELMAAIFGLVMSLLAWIALRPSYFLMVFLGWLLGVCNTFWMSQPRHLLCLFPIFLLLGKLTKDNRVFYATLVTFLFFHIFYVNVFTQGHWAF